jgi:hypothetical protein
VHDGEIELGMGAGRVPAGPSLPNLQALLAIIDGIGHRPHFQASRSEREIRPRQVPLGHHIGRVSRGEPAADFQILLVMFYCLVQSLLLAANVAHSTVGNGQTSLNK